jgi:hypothetical protein
LTLPTLRGYQRGLILILIMLQKGAGGAAQKA